MKLVVAYAERIKQLMQERDMSVEEFAQKSKFPIEEVKRLLDNPLECKNVDAESLVGIWRAFDMPLYDFFQDPLFDMDNLEDTRQSKEKKS